MAERIRRSATSDRPFRYLLRAVAALFGVVIVLFVWSIVKTAWPAITTYGVNLVVGRTWIAGTGPYGALPLIIDTLSTTAIALIFAVPVGLATALALQFVIPRRLRGPAASLVELLAAVPSVVYGLWGIAVMVPWLITTLQPFLAHLTGGSWPFNGSQQGFSILLAGIVLAIMILPTIVAVSRDVIATVPADLMEGALSLGATRGQVLTRVVLPTARTGILGAIALATGRALGETIAVAMVIGSNAQIPHSLFSSGATLASTIAVEFGNAVGTEGGALAALALILMVITGAVNFGARALTRRAGAR
ncbi:MAG: phosphate ABC transporter permease subunit PstC [Acidobacteriota bacterium]|nr:phosphate ABC transporter permease subunit PstC [Acidobacteriota bacterium]